MPPSEGELPSVLDDFVGEPGEDDPVIDEGGDGDGDEGEPEGDSIIGSDDPAVEDLLDGDGDGDGADPKPEQATVSRKEYEELLATNEKYVNFMSQLAAEKEAKDQAAQDKVSAYDGYEHTKDLDETGRASATQHVLAALQDAGIDLNLLKNLPQFRDAAEYSKVNQERGEAVRKYGSDVTSDYDKDIAELYRTGQTDADYETAMIFAAGKRALAAKGIASAKRTKDLAVKAARKKATESKDNTRPSSDGPSIVIPKDMRDGGDVLDLMLAGKEFEGLD